MIITAWILFIFFGFFALVMTLAMFMPSVRKLNMVAYIFYMVMTAIMAGIIWGGLFR